MPFKHLLKRFRQWLLVPLEEQISAQTLSIQNLRSQNSTPQNSSFQEASTALTGQPFPPSPPYVYLGENCALTRTIWGHKLFVDTRDRSLAPHIVLDGYWEMGITRCLQSRIRAGMMMIEVGTNIGYYTTLAAAQLGEQGKLYAFEANPQVFQLMYHSLSVNGLLSRVIPVNKAVYSQTQTLNFSCFKHNQGGSTIRTVSQHYTERTHDEVEVLTIEAVSLDDYFGDDLPVINLIKIDAEGSEAHIIKGMQRLIKNSPQLEMIFEFSRDVIKDTGETPETMLNFLQTEGFQFSVIQPDGELQAIAPEQLLQIKFCEVFASRQPEKAAIL